MACAIIQTPSGFILSKRSIKPYKGLWHIPGGTVLFGETIKEAMSRIAEDELGIKIDNEQLLGYIEYPGEAKERGYGWTIGFAFLAGVSSGEPKGSKQGEIIGFFKGIPAEIIPDQKRFLKVHLNQINEYKN